MGTATLAKAALAKAALARVRNEPAKVVEALQLQADSEDYGWSKISSLVWTPPYIAALLDLGHYRALYSPTRWWLRTSVGARASPGGPNQPMGPWNFARAPVPIAFMDFRFLWSSVKLSR